MIFDGLKKIGAVVSGAKKVISVADRLNDDIDGDGKMEMVNIKEDCVALEEQIVKVCKSRYEDLKSFYLEFSAACKRDYEDIMVQVKLTMNRIDKLKAHLEEAK